MPLTAGSIAGSNACFSRFLQIFAMDFLRFCSKVQGFYVILVFFLYRFPHGVSSFFFFLNAPLAYVFLYLL